MNVLHPELKIHARRCLHWVARRCLTLGGAPHRFHPLLASVDALVGTGTYIKDASRFVEVANAVFLRNESGMLLYQVGSISFFVTLCGCPHVPRYVITNPCGLLGFVLVSICLYAAHAQ